MRTPGGDDAVVIRDDYAPEVATFRHVDISRTVIETPEIFKNGHKQLIVILILR
jgi:hypothetical protein